MSNENQKKHDSALSHVSSAAQFAKGAMKTGKALAGAAKGAAAGPYEMVAARLWENRKFIGKILAALAALLMLPILFILMLPSLIFHIEKLLLDSAHDSYPVYEYCRRENITPFIDLNPGNTRHFTYKDDFTIDDDDVPICRAGLRMHKDGYEAAKHRTKYRCPKADRRQGCLCGHPCSPAKYGRTVHISTSDNPRLFNIPPMEKGIRWKDFRGTL